MRLNPLIILIAFVMAGTTSAASEVVAPDWSLQSAQGKTVRLSEEVQKQPTIVLFWATWCPYCKALMPHLQSMRLEYGERIKILAVNFRENGDPVGFIRKAGFDFTVLPEGDEVAAAYDVYTTPGVVIVDRHRVIRFDLRSLPPQQPLSGDEPANHSRKAAYRAPYWAAEIRKSLDAVLSDSSQ